MPSRLRVVALLVLVGACSSKKSETVDGSSDARTADANDAASSDANEGGFAADAAKESVSDGVADTAGDAAAKDLTGTETGDASGTEAGAADLAGPDLSPGACLYAVTLDLPGEVLRSAEPTLGLAMAAGLAPGETFRCLRVEYDIETTTREVLLSHMAGCPIFVSSHGVQSNLGKKGASHLIGGLLFRPFKVKQPTGVCEATDTKIEMDTFWGSPNKVAPWVPGKSYHVVSEITAMGSSTALYEGATMVGPRLEVLADIPAADRKDPLINLSLPKSFEGAFLPYYDAVFSNLEVQADTRP